MLIEGDDNLIDDLMQMAHFENFGQVVDMVNSPPHYQSDNGVECIEAIEAANGMDGFIAYLRGTAIKYIWRAGKKWDDVEDVEKAIWYMERMKECLNRKQLP
jgi:hypothetical protein